MSGYLAAGPAGRRRRLRVPAGIGRTAVSATVLAALVGPFVLAAPAQAAPRNVRESQWYLAPLKVAQAQQITKGAGVVVAVVDSPVYATHPDLTGQVLQGSTTAVDGPANGWAPNDRSAEHGTAMASVIAAKGGDNNHMLGIAPAAKILPVADSAIGGTSNSQTTAKAIRWAVDHGAKVINVSLGHMGASHDYEVAAIRYALDHDVVVVAAVGNTSQGVTEVLSPASIPGVIAVAGTTSAGAAWSGSVHGAAAVIAAPAVQITVALPPVVTASGYSLADGTSAATAMISGVAALVRAKYPQLNAANVINRLIKTAKDAGAPGRDSDFGFGIVQPLEALTANVPTVTANPLGGDTPVASASSTPSVPAVASRDGSGSRRGTMLIGFAVVAGIVVLGAIVLIFVLRAARARRARTYPYPPVPYQQPPTGVVPAPAYRSSHTNAYPPISYGPPGQPGESGYPGSTGPGPSTHWPPGTGTSSGGSDHAG